MTLKKIPLAGVIGAPIAHTKSPRLHGHWLRQTGVPGHYIPLHIEPNDLKEALKILPKMGFVGLNVTVPHKEAVMHLVDIVTDRATLIGAVNTLIFSLDGKIHADNTDGFGFIENLRSGVPNWDPTAGPALVLGAGGAARAVIAALLEYKVPEIYLTNRTRDRAENLKDIFGPQVTIVDWIDAANAIEDVVLVVNATSLGMLGKPELRVPLDGLRPNVVVNDLVYVPLKTTLLETAEYIGCRTVDGLGMLIHQAAPGFRHWFGADPTIDDQTRAFLLK
ncbi:MAG: shikimate dehydrogenase [Paracoccaceae bacterium]|nr:shikimate dehydrogenase [Paracoccaceae bacterium]